MMSEAKAETVWNLQPITGNAPSYWAPEPNWTWTDGNPMTVSGAKWLLAAQFDWNPSLTATYTNLVGGNYVNYYRVWRGPGQTSTEPSNRYLNFSLCTGNGTGVSAGPSSVILFTPPEAGLYRFELAAGVSIQQKTAGYVRATVYTLSGDGTSASELAVLPLNMAGGYGSPGYPSNLVFNATLDLAANERFAVRVQTVNPGAGSAGNSSINFGAAGGLFKVTQVPDGTAIYVY